MEQLLQSLDVSPLVRGVIGVGIIIVVFVLAVLVARFVLNVLARRLAARTRTTLDDHLLKAVRRPLSMLVYLIGLKVLVDYVEDLAGGNVGVGPFRIMDGVLFVLMALVVTMLVVRTISSLIAWYGKNIASRTETEVDDQFLPLADRAVKTILYILGVLIILDHFQVDIKGLLTVLGVGSLAVALASQETIANMIGGFVIMVDRPFRVGDRIRLDDGTVCRVHQIGIRSTKFQTFENTLIIVPNAELMKSTVHNLTYPIPETRVKVDVGVSYDEDLDQVKAAMLDEAGKHPLVLKEPPPEFRFLNFGDSSLDVSLRCRVENIRDQFRTSCELREQIFKRFNAEGIEIPFPQRVITMAGSGGVAEAVKPVSAQRQTTKEPRREDYDMDGAGGDDDDDN